MEVLEVYPPRVEQGEARAAHLVRVRVRVGVGVRVRVKVRVRVSVRVSLRVSLRVGVGVEQREAGAAHREPHGREQAGAEGGAAPRAQEDAVVQHAHHPAPAAKPERRRRRGAARV